MDYTNILKLKKPSYDDPVDIKVLKTLIQWTQWMLGFLILLMK